MSTATPISGTERKLDMQQLAADVVERALRAGAKEAEVVIQVNGKLRGRINVAFGTPREALEKLVLADSKVQPLLDGKQVVKVIVVPDKLVNIVVK